MTLLIAEFAVGVLLGLGYAQYGDRWARRKY